MQATPKTYAGLFLIALSTLMYEVMLTRIFSITTWYHFAFLVISLAMLGMTVGAIVVYLGRAKLNDENIYHYLTVSALAFSIISVLAVLLHIATPMFVPLDARAVIMASLLVAALPLLIAFVCSGICVSLALTRFPQHLNRLYAFDLVGAALGCIYLVVSLHYLDGISELFLIGLIGSVSALCFSLGAGERKLRMGAASCAVVMVVLLGLNAYGASEQKPMFKLYWSKGEVEQNVLYEKWNSFSRIRVFGQPEKLQELMEFGLSAKFKPALARFLSLDLDGSAGTHLYKYHDKSKDVDFIKNEVAEVAHSIRPNADVLVIGVGGGKDILGALLMGQKSVTGVEINDNIIKTTNGRYGDYTGHLDRYPNVKIFNDEARSYVTRSNRKFDIIQATLVDTWAASSSGAYALSENALYTTDAWKVFLNHLTPNGVVSMTRWYGKDMPAEIYRLINVAATALRQIGVTDPSRNIMVVRVMSGSSSQPDGLGTILVSRSPFSDQDLEQIEKVCDKNGFQLAFSPKAVIDPNLKFAAQGNLGELAKTVPFDISATSDDRPFFFQNLSLSHIFDPRIYAESRNANNVMAALALIIAMVAVLFFSFYCVRLPFLMTKDKTVLQGTTPYFGYFFSIGMGYMLVELSQIQRLNIFLGPDPIYGMVVVLFTLLLATGLGSMLFGKLGAVIEKNPATPLVALVAVAGLYGLMAPFVATTYVAESTPIRIAITGLMLFPLGLVLGMAFPLGMKLAFNRHAAVTPWLWGINGAASVCGSVLAILVSMFVGISASYWLGFAFYLCALALVWFSIRNK